jgi:hypothetical protein
MSLKDWKLKLRYGKATTPYKHFTVLGPCIVGQLDENFSCPPGNAYVGVKTWATTTDQAAEIFESIGRQIGYEPIDKVEVFTTDAVQPPKDEPYGYDIQFTPYKDDA